jgi:hypothetical protein
MSDFRLERIAAVQREIDEGDAGDQAVDAHLAGRGRRAGAGPSVVYSIRLDPGEMAALERRAAALGIRPSVLARNLVRTGLRGRDEDRLPGLVDRLDAAVQELRALVR